MQKKKFPRISNKQNTSEHILAHENSKREKYTESSMFV